MQKDPHSFRTSNRLQQQGVTLIELMVGIAIGLLTVAVAIGALLASKNASISTSDSTTMQQQAAYAFRVIGQQIRQAGSLSLEPSTSYLESAYFRNNLAIASYPPISGKDSPGSNEYKLTVTYQNAPIDKIYPLAADGTASTGSLLRNCLGENPSSSPPEALQSAFKLDSNILYCAGTSSKQPIIGGSQTSDIKVKDFVVRYVSQQGYTNPTFAYSNASAFTDNTAWSKVQSVEVCIELEGSDSIDTVGSNYINCSNETVSRGNRLRMVFRNTFRSRSHAWPTSS
ncbi:hypothetical protein DJFAAGMI_02675 [Comamonas sp. PE63]|uniref:Prepilin-type N-terminal cleavage/methylation domain-containing protein n=1 Tax=Comamonas brasiliensis TaxID=1812482 RepID=A0ABS5LTU5_9BURK|nr:prepilin-type N-terminal cleavage/methylation domain-containing protein [Comamonas sp. PE63]MBS3019921.1 hypothetical protein [Comamonas sp. PE63]